MSPESRAQRRERQRQRLLEHARALFAEKGVDATSLTDVASAAGLTTPALYRYFDSRRALEVEALRSATASTVDEVAAAEAVGGPARARLAEFARQHADYLESSGRGLVRFVYWSVLEAAGDDRTAHEIDPGHEASDRFFRAFVRDATAGRALPDGLDEDLLVELLDSLFTGIDLRYAVGRAARRPTDVYAAAVALLAMALEPHPGS